jgi:hypothetical protein
MLASDSLIPSFWPSLVASLMILLLSGVIGRLLMGARLHGVDALERFTGSLAVGLLVLVGTGVTVVFGRFGQHSLAPLLWLLAAIAAWKWLARAEKPSGGLFSAIAALAVVLALSLAWHLWVQNAAWAADGTLRLEHSDMGFYALLAHGMPEAGVANGWSATTGGLLVDSHHLADFWYHWGPVWLGMLIRLMTGLGALESTLVVGPVVMTTILVLQATVLIRTLTGWRTGAALLAGLACLVLLPFPLQMQTHFMPFLQHGQEQHWRHSLMWLFPYQFEAVQLFAALLAWLRGRWQVALLFIACATWSSPHFVGGAGVAAGTWMCLGFVKRDRALWRPAGSVVLTILAAWAVMHLVVGVTMSTGLEAEGGSVGSLGLWGMLKLVPAMLSDSLATLIFSALLVPGWIALIRAREPSAESDRVRALGWLCFAALVGSMAAYALFVKQEQRFHFTDFPAAVIYLPLGGAGLAMLLARGGRYRVLPLLVLALVTAFGLKDLRVRKQSQYLNPRSITGLTPEQCAAFKKQLGGAAFGYFATEDRSWWIPRLSMLGAWLDARCIRVNRIDQADVHNRFTKFYKTIGHYDVLPEESGGNLDEWHLKLCQRLQIRFLIELESHPLPESLKSRCQEVCRFGKKALYRVPEPL